MTVSRTLFSSTSDEWQTPPDLYNALDAEFHFTLDPCATAENAKCERFFAEEDNGLAQDWGGWGETAFVNPPYSAIKQWMEKGFEESCKGAIVVCLVPARTDTQWWNDWVVKTEADVTYIQGRLRFSGGKSSAPFPSAVVVFRPHWYRTYRRRTRGARRTLSLPES